MRKSDSAPASVNRMAMTIASLGRSTKTAEIISRFPQALRTRSGLRPGNGQGWRAGRPGVDLHPGAHALDAVGDNHFALLQATGDNRGGRRGLAQLDAALFDLLVAADNVHIVA